MATPRLVKVVESSVASSLLFAGLCVPPTSASLVTRPRLLRESNEGEACVPIFLSPPPGYGKRTFVIFGTAGNSQRAAVRSISYTSVLLQPCGNQSGNSVLSAQENAFDPPRARHHGLTRSTYTIGIRNSRPPGECVPRASVSLARSASNLLMISGLLGCFLNGLQPAQESSSHSLCRCGWYWGP